MHEQIPILRIDRDPIQQPHERDRIHILQRHPDPILSPCRPLRQPRVEQDQQGSDEGGLGESVPERFALTVEVEDHAVKDDGEGDVEGGEAG